MRVTLFALCALVIFEQAPGKLTIGVSAVSVPNGGRVETVPTISAHLTFGENGPVRTDHVFQQGETVSVTIGMLRLREDADGNTKAKVWCVLRDASQSPIARVSPKVVQRNNVLKRGCDVVLVSMSMGKNDMPGPYWLEVFVQDEVAESQSSLLLPFVVEPPTLSIVNEFISRSESGEYASSGVFTIGEEVWFRFGVSGLSAQDGKHKLRSSISIIDAEQNGHGEEHLEYEVLEQNGPIGVVWAVPLTSPGSFVAEMTVLDEITQQSVYTRIPFRVERPLGFPSFSEF